MQVNCMCDITAGTNMMVCVLCVCFGGGGVGSETRGMKKLRLARMGKCPLVIGCLMIAVELGVEVPSSYSVGWLEIVARDKV